MQTEEKPVPGGAMSESEGRYRMDWLAKHRNADEIVVNLETGDPVKAVYRTIHGVPRTFPAEYYYNPEVYA